VRRKRWTALLAGLAVLAAACGGDDEGAAGAEIDEGATLVYAQSLTGSGFSQRLQPNQMTAICDFMVGSQVFSTLIRRDTKTNQPEPGLAESFRIVDARTFELTLRPGLTFHDGTVLDAAAAKAGIDRNRALGSTLAPTLAEIDSVEAGPDGRTVTLRLRTDSAAIMPLTLAGREGHVAAAASTDTHPIGAGPFRFVSQVVGDNIVLERFDGYWDAENVRLAGLRYVNAEGPPAINALLAGDVDLTLGNPDVNRPAENDPDVSIEKASGSDYWKLNLDVSKAPLDDVAFRQGLNHAIDKQAILDTLFRGEGEVATQPFPRGFARQHQPELADRYPHDPDRARQLFQQAGATNVTLEASYPANNPTFQRYAEIVQAQLRDVGVNVNLTPSTNLLQTYFQQRQGQFIFTLWPARPDPSVTIQRQFGRGQITNVGGYTNPVIDQALARIRGSESEAEQAQGYREAVEVIVEEALDVPIAFPALTYPHRDHVVSDDWQLYGACQGVDFSKLAITTAKGR
jgi:peptide/nickel transport system substrate-binding protein